jgi:proline dehydrogenase
LFRLATSTRLERAARAAPLGERLAWRAASRYVAGVTAAAAAQVTRELQDRGVASSIDQFGELVQDTGTAERVAASYLGLADQVTHWLTAASMRLPRPSKSECRSINIARGRAA